MRRRVTRQGIQNAATAMGMMAMSGRGFRSQSGVSATNFYQAGVEAAQAAFQAGGVNALLAFLAGFNAGQ